MLKYFKRQKSQRSVEDANDVAGAEKRHSLLSTSSFCDEILGEEDSQSIDSTQLNIINEDIFNYNSRLSMSIASILKDPDCMSCFVQYLETQNALPLIKFYLDIENFRTAALGQLERQQHQKSSTIISDAQNKTEINEALNNDNIENSCLQENITEAASNVPELKTLCDLSMHKPLTDDEKSQIYAETTKQITKCVSNTGYTQTKATSLLSLTSELSIDGSNGASISAASVKDAIAIYQKYLCPNAKLFVELPVEILSEISLLLCQRQDEEETDVSTENLLSISANCFDDAQKFVLNTLENLYLTDFLQSCFYCKFCLELICDEKRAQQLTIYDVLYSEVALFFFMEFLEQKGQRDCLDFWTTAINFRKSYVDPTLKTVSLQEIQEDAMIIYKKFFSLQAEGRLWLSDKLRCHVESAICAPPEQIANCFDLALTVTAKYLEKKYFGAFLKSEPFAQYVNELKTKLQESHCGNGEYADADVLDSSTLHKKLSFKNSKTNLNATTTKRKHRKTLSDCTNETIGRGDLSKHISQRNTLLAMDSSAMNFKHLTNNSTTLSIDARQLTNPNMLWHRRYSTGGDSLSGGGLKFGRVNSLGRYERDFESIESFNNQHSSGKHHWSLGVSGSKIKNAMRKLVNLPEQNAQEEIAWQIAEMIVNDVTSVTLKNSPLDKNNKSESTINVARKN